MFERLLLLVGGIEIFVGGLMYTFPTLFPPWVGLAVAAFGVLTMIAAVLLIASDFRKGRIRGASVAFVPQWHFHATFDDYLPFRRTILLTEAAQHGRDETLLRRAGDASEQLSMRNDPLSWMATSLGMLDTYDGSKFPGPLRLYGRRFDSTRRILIPIEERKRLTIVDRGAALRDPGGKKYVYTHLEILRHEMKKRVRYLRGME